MTQIAKEAQVATVAGESSVQPERIVVPQLPSIEVTLSLKPGEAIAVSGLVWAASDGGLGLDILGEIMREAPSKPGGK